MITVELKLISFKTFIAQIQHFSSPNPITLSIKLAKYETANSGDITNLSQDLDSTVETIYYEEGAEKIRELEQNIACLEKYIKELETSVHLQRTQNAVLRNKVDNTFFQFTIIRFSDHCTV